MTLVLKVTNLKYGKYDMTSKKKNNNKRLIDRAKFPLLQLSMFRSFVLFIAVHYRGVARGGFQGFRNPPHAKEPPFLFLTVNLDS